MDSEMNRTIRERGHSFTSFEPREENGLITVCFPKRLYFMAILQASF